MDVSSWPIATKSACFAQVSFRGQSRRELLFALRRPELGSLKPGSVGDATIISVKEGRFDYVDIVGEHLIGERTIVSEGVVIGGCWWHPKPSAKVNEQSGQAGLKVM